MGEPDPVDDPPERCLTVVPIRRDVNEDLVEKLETLLLGARCGELRSLAYVGQMIGQEFAIGCSHEVGYTQLVTLLGAVELLKTTVLKQMSGIEYSRPMPTG